MLITTKCTTKCSLLLKHAYKRTSDIILFQIGRSFHLPTAYLISRRILNGIYLHKYICKPNGFTISRCEYKHFPMNVLYSTYTSISIGPMYLSGSYNVYLTKRSIEDIEKNGQLPLPVCP